MDARGLNGIWGRRVAMLVCFAVLILFVNLAQARKPATVSATATELSCSAAPSDAIWRATPAWLWLLAIEDIERPAAENFQAFEASQKVFLDGLFAALDARFVAWNRGDPRLIGALQNLLADVAAMARFYDPTREYKFTFHKSIQLRLQTFLRARNHGRAANRLTPSLLPPNPDSAARRAREYAALYPVNIARDEGWMQAAILLHLVRSDETLRQALDTYRRHARTLHDATPHWTRLFEAGKSLSFALPQDIENEENLQALRRAYEAGENTPGDGETLAPDGGPVLRPFPLLALEGADFTRSVPVSWRDRPGPWSGALSLLAEAGSGELKAQKNLDGIAGDAVSPHLTAWELCLGPARLSEDFPLSAVAACFGHRASPTDRGPQAFIPIRPPEIAARPEAYAALAGLAREESVRHEGKKAELWWTWAGRFAQLATLSREAKGRDFEAPAAWRSVLGRLPDLGLPVLWRVTGSNGAEPSSARLGMGSWRCRTWTVHENDSGEDETQKEAAKTVFEPFVEYGERSAGYPLKKGDASILDAARYLPLPYLNVGLRAETRRNERD